MFIVFQSEVYFDWMVRLLGLSLFIQSCELLQLKSVWSENGLYPWKIVRKNIRFFCPVLDLLFKENVFHKFILLNAIFALVLLIFGLSWAIIYPLVFICLVFIRLRGSFNGGSDAMTAIVVAVCAGRILFPESEKVAKFCLWYLALQVVLSYFVAGIVKIKNSSWRHGDALNLLVTKSNYVVPEKVLTLLKMPLVSLIGCWVILVFECSFPLVLFSKNVALFYLGFAFVFHLANFYLFGLNRFVWAWIAAYPALWCVVSLKL